MTIRPFEIYIFESDPDAHSKRVAASKKAWETRRQKAAIDG